MFRSVRTGWRVAGLLLVTLFLAGCDLPSFGMPHPATKQADSAYALWQGMVLAALIVGVIVWGLIFWSVIRYRRRDDRIPKQFVYNIPLEILYTAIPIVMIVGIFFFAVHAEHNVDHKVANPAVKVEVRGFQWQWQFDYTQDHILVTGAGSGPLPQLVVPAGQTVQVHLVSLDVVHSFWVPDFLFKRDLIPGVDNTVQFEVKAPGKHIGRCAAYCGLGHDTMEFVVVAVPPDEYQRWVTEHRGKSLSPQQEGYASDMGVITR